MVKLPSLETRHLLLLAALDERGSLNAAARKLHVSPSALSQQLRDLEERLGGALFRRQWRRLSLTRAGRRLTDSAHAVLRELERAESETRELLRGASGTIRVATMCHQSYRWLPEVLRAFTQSWPGVDVTVVAEAAAEPQAWIVQRQLDVALVAEVVKPDRRVRLTPLFRDELVALVGRGHAWFGRKSVPVRALAEQHVWADEGAFRRDSALGKALAREGEVAPRKVTLVPMSGIVAIEMARENLGITVMPRWAVEALVAEGDLSAVRIGSRGVWLDWAVAVRNEELEPAHAGFVRALAEHHPRARKQPRARRSG
jgi:LysR family transcriptional regulator, regulator for metE and metH